MINLAYVWDCMDTFSCSDLQQIALQLHINIFILHVNVFFLLYLFIFFFVLFCISNFFKKYHIFFIFDNTTPSA